MAAMTFDEVERAVAEIAWAHDAGFRGILLPSVTDDAQLYDLRYEPIWNELEERDMVVNSHVSLSADIPQYGSPPHRTTTIAVFGIDAFYAVQRVLRVLIWGGVLERHPRLNVIFTEQQSDWVAPLLARMDFSYERGDLRRDIRSIVPMKPSDYWQRQCYLGSSIFSKAEIRARGSISRPIWTGRCRPSPSDAHGLTWGSTSAPNLLRKATLSFMSPAIAGWLTPRASSSWIRFTQSPGVPAMPHRSRA
jgi:hypothetical protein